MKNCKLLVIIALIVTPLGCAKEKPSGKQEYIFLKRYCATVTVGGVVGLAERCFEIGEVVVGFEKTNATVTIRIAEHGPLNDGPPSNTSYQEFLDVPSDYLRLKD